MNKLIAALFALGMVFASVPAFACDGHEKASSDTSDAVMTSVDDGDKATDATKAKKAKKAKKDDDTKADGEKAGEEKGEV